MQDDDVSVDDKDEGSHRIENDPQRGGKSAPPLGPRQPRRGEGAPGRGEQPGGGRRAESDKPQSPSSRGGGGEGPARR
jgi:hypothetical protein